MKRIFRNNSLIVITLITIFSLTTTSAVFAQKEAGQQVELKFLGKKDYQPLFELNVNGSAQENFFTISVRDEYYNLLYTENIKAPVISKRFLINTDELGNGPVTFEIYNRKTRKTSVFEISSNRYYTDEMVVSEVK